MMTMREALAMLQRLDPLGKWTLPMLYNATHVQGYRGAVLAVAARVGKRLRIDEADLREYAAKAGEPPPKSAAAGKARAR
jgi:hypothetical protein